MTDDAFTPKANTNGTPFLGLETRHRQTLRKKPTTNRQQPGPVREEHKRPIWKLDPLDIEAQGGAHAKGEDLILDEPIPSIVTESQIVWAIIGRIDEGPWSYQFAGENIRAATFPSRRRAEGIMSWLRQMAQKDSNGAEYKIIALMRAEQNL